MSGLSPTAPRALLISIGGSPNPVLYSIEQLKPEHVWFFCSPNSKHEAQKVWDEIRDPDTEIVRRRPEEAVEAEKILGRIRAHPGFKRTNHDLLVVERFEELGACYETLRTSIQGLLTKWQVKPEDVTVDYTGGTKTMSAALVMAGLECFENFSYIGGLQRDKDGLGVIIDGSQRALYQTNPWSNLAIRDVERARDLWNAAHFHAASQNLAHAALRVPQKHLFKTISDVAAGLASRHRLDFKEAANVLWKAAHSLRLLFDGKPDYDLIPFVEDAAGLCETCSKPRASRELLGELLDNTIRTATQHRFEDAAARLYRCMEMQLQIWLEEKTSGLFRNGKCDEYSDQGALEKRVPALAGCDSIRPHRYGGFKLGLTDIIKVLGHLGDERAAKALSDQADKASKLLNAASLRNEGILAHGTRAVKEEGFEQFKAVAAEFFGLDLTRERHPIPPLDPRWFHFHNS